MTIEVRTAETTDVDAIARINVEGWRSAYDGIVPADFLAAMTVDDRRERWREHLAAADPAGPGFLVGVIDGEVAAYAAFGPYRTQQDAPSGEDTAGWGEMYALYTDPVRQGRGVGGSLHDAALAELGRRGCREAALWVLRDNRHSRAWYGRRGWYADGATSTWDADGVPLPEVRLRHPRSRHRPTSTDVDLGGGGGDG